MPCSTSNASVRHTNPKNVLILAIQNEILLREIRAVKVALVHNEYGKFSGEEFVVDSQLNLLLQSGVEVATFFRSSVGLDRSITKKMSAFFTGVYSYKTRREFEKFLDVEHPDVIHVHNIYPKISPSIFIAAAKRKIPVVMTVHNYRLVCPNGLFYSHGQICRRCEGGRELNALLRNCEENWLKSLGYALRNWNARRKRYFLDGVSLFLCLTQFQASVLTKAGFPQERIKILPNTLARDGETVIQWEGSYIGFAGRLAESKGVNMLIQLAKELPDIVFKVAGSGELENGLYGEMPKNIEFLGHLDERGMRAFYRGCKVLIFPSKCYEGMPIVLLEAMQQGIPVICSRLGGLPDIVVNGETGFVVTHDDLQAFKDKLVLLLNDQILYRDVSSNAMARYNEIHNLDRYKRSLMEFYQMVLE
jgi:glycosyltransferase involved in cell wall biosynthesis